MGKIWFDERIAECYDESSVEMYRPDVLEPTVDFLKDLAGSRVLHPE